MQTFEYWLRGIYNNYFAANQQVNKALISQQFDRKSIQSLLANVRRAYANDKTVVRLILRSGGEDRFLRNT